MNKVVIGNATLYNNDFRDVFPNLETVDAVITDPPYSLRTHRGHNSGAKIHRDGMNRNALKYNAMTTDQAQYLAEWYVRVCTGWIVWMTDSVLAQSISDMLEDLGRYVFAPLPFYSPGRSVRLSGDGPCSWTDWIVVARTKAQCRWRTLPGGYVMTPEKNGKFYVGGKPVRLMDALVMDYSQRGDVVLDTHMGSGTTGVACIKASRRFIGCEIDARAFDIACKRIEATFAQRPLLDVDVLPPLEQASLL